MQVPKQESMPIEKSNAIDKNMRAKQKRIKSKRRALTRERKNQRREPDAVFPWFETLVDTSDTSDGVSPELSMVKLQGDDGEIFTFNRCIADQYFDYVLPKSDPVFIATEDRRKGTPFSALCKFIEALRDDGGGLKTDQFCERDIKSFYQAAYFFRATQCLLQLRVSMVEAIAVNRADMEKKMQTILELTMLFTATFSLGEALVVLG